MDWFEKDFQPNMFDKIALKKIEPLTSIASLKSKATGSTTTWKQGIHAAKRMCLVDQAGRLEEQEQHSVCTVGLWNITGCSHCCDIVSVLLANQPILPRQ